jgi:K+-sensing histidine kinase KdpD
MSSESLSQLSAGAKADSRIGTNNEMSTGLGVDLSEEFINVMEVSLNFRSKLRKGTNVTILIKAEA